MKKIKYPKSLLEAIEYLKQLGMTKDETQTDEIGQVEAEVSRTFTYDDMIKAFTTGRRHYKECGNTNNDCWDFTTRFKEQYG